MFWFSDNSVIVLSKTEYDNAGRVTKQIDALGEETLYSYSFPVEGGEQTTITTPDGGTSIRTTYSDGRTKEVSGTAVAPVRYEYGTWTDATDHGEWTKTIRVGEGNSETEWTKTYTDIAGRTVRVEYADGSEATMDYNNKGQLVKQVDADGVTTLFIRTEAKPTDSPDAPPGSP